MRLANLAGRAVLVVDGGALDLERASDGRFDADPADAIGRFEEVVAVAPSLEGPVEPLETAKLGPPSPRPSQIIAIGMNYHSHALEMGLELPSIPAAFAKFRSALGGPFGEIALPSTSVDHEVEIVLVIGKPSYKLRLDDAWDHVAGITAGQDLSERVVQMAAGRQFSLGKSYPKFASIGPWLTSVDELADPNDVGLGCAIDGETVQDARSSDMAFSVPELLVALTEVISLAPGDVLFTGSPAGAGMGHHPPRYLKPGQVLTTWVESVGEMRHELVGADA
jgi:2-keto-4-pentenoate hydratase/2-oxohepta-3-ene-1,7-dioic acid hydratase in catechol pathway